MGKGRIAPEVNEMRWYFFKIMDFIALRGKGERRHPIPDFIGLTIKSKANKQNHGFLERASKIVTERIFRKKYEVVLLG